MGTLSPIKTPFFEILTNNPTSLPPLSENHHFYSSLTSKTPQKSLAAAIQKPSKNA
jgi:hypothetical protein